MKSIPIASLFWPGLYEHEKPTKPYMELIDAKEKWYCDDCGRTVTVLLHYHTGLVACPKCQSRFIVPVSELPNTHTL